MAERANIVLILTDQLRADVLGAYGAQTVRTPHLDRLASEGMRLDRAFTPSGICSPARNSLLTGLYPHGHGVLNNVSGPDAVNDDVPEDVSMLPALLAAEGYRTAHIGKYHVAAHEAPKRHGFTDAAAPWMFWDDADYHAWRADQGYPVDPTDRAALIPISDWTTPRPLTAAGAERHEQRGFPVMGRLDIPLEASQPAWVLEQAIRFLDDVQHTGEPFFLVVSFLGPHWPHLLPEPYWSMYDRDPIPPWPNFVDTLEGKPGSQRKSLVQHGVEGWTWEQWQAVVATYFGSVTMHDELIGRLLDALDERGQDDALVVATTDHGDMTGSHRLFNKGPYAYEELYRIPMLVRWPGRVEPGSSTNAFTNLVDLMPTFLAATGTSVPEDLHGRDLAAVLDGEVPTTWPTSAFAEYFGNEYGLYTQRLLRTGRYKLVYNAHDRDELYDLVLDPHELVNLSDDPLYAEVKRALEAELWRWMDETNDPHAGPSGNILA